jgi:hypothetical protein
VRSSQEPMMKGGQDISDLLDKRISAHPHYQDLSSGNMAI